MPRSAGAEQSKASYIPVTTTENSGPEIFISPTRAGVTRNNTQIIPAHPSRNATIGGQSQVRSLSMRRPGVITPPKGAHLQLIHI